MEIEDGTYPRVVGEALCKLGHADAKRALEPIVSFDSVNLWVPDSHVPQWLEKNGQNLPCPNMSANAIE